MFLIHGVYVYKFGTRTMQSFNNRKVPNSHIDSNEVIIPAIYKRVVMTLQTHYLSGIPWLCAFFATFVCCLNLHMVFEK